MRRRNRKSDCPVHFALEVFGDAWTLLVVRDLMFKNRTTYTELLRADEGIATNILADRLVRLEEDGIIAKERNKARLTAELRSALETHPERQDKGGAGRSARRRDDRPSANRKNHKMEVSS